MGSRDSEVGIRFGALLAVWEATHAFAAEEVVLLELTARATSLMTKPCRRIYSWEARLLKGLQVSKWRFLDAPRRLRYLMFWVTHSSDVVANEAIDDSDSSELDERGDTACSKLCI